MKVAISVTAALPDAPFDARFGRAAAFVIVDTEMGKRGVVLNPAADAVGGAGIQAAEFIIRHEVGAVISGAFGPNAYDALTTGHIEMFQAEAGTIDELVHRYENGKLQQVAEPVGKGSHHGGRSR